MSEPTHSSFCLFALGATAGWGDAVAAHLHIPVAPHEERAFEDGEHKLRPLVNVRGRDAFVLSSLYGDATQSAGEKLCRLLFFVGALKDASARSVTAVVPYLAYARKDRKTQTRDPVATRYVAALFEAVGTDRMLTLDAHNLAAYQNAFRCRTDHLEAGGLFALHFAQRLRPDEPLAVVSPDAGGIKRAEQLRLRLEQLLHRPVAAAFAEKHRALGVVSGQMLVGDVAGRCAIIVDDLIATGTTLGRTAQALRDHGATAVHAVASHGLFVGDAAHALAQLDSLVVTGSVPPFRLPPGPVLEKLKVISTAPLFAEAIRRIHEGGSLNELLGH